jgi:hypothetical protein
MKTRLILGFLLVMFSVQTMGMGHPHNLFAARKLVKTKSARVQSRAGLATAVKPGFIANWILNVCPRAVKAVM